MIEPTFTHDCGNCTFIGVINGKDGRTLDAYCCEQGGFMPTIVLRFGDDGPDYVSGQDLRFDNFRISVPEPEREEPWEKIDFLAE